MNNNNIPFIIDISDILYYIIPITLQYLFWYYIVFTDKYDRNLDDSDLRNIGRIKSFTSTIIGSIILLFIVKFILTHNIIITL